MAIEIERRFLLNDDSWKQYSYKKVLIEQGYLSNQLEDWIVRIRFNGNHFKLALKKHIKNFTSFEFEYIIPNEDGEKIMSNIVNTIKKERFFLEYDHDLWIIDCFKEENFPLVIAEIELSEEKERLKIPSFIREEITGIKKFSNFSLATHPFSKWDNNNLEILEES